MGNPKSLWLENDRKWLAIRTSWWLNSPTPLKHMRFRQNGWCSSPIVRGEHSKKYLRNATTQFWDHPLGVYQASDTGVVPWVTMNFRSIFVGYKLLVVFQPPFTIWKRCAFVVKLGDFLPQGFWILGWKFQKYLSCHHQGNHGCLQNWNNKKNKETNLHWNTS